MSRPSAEFVTVTDTEDNTYVVRVPAVTSPGEFALAG